MAVYRHIHIDYWQDGFVLDLTPEEKYFYIYLMTNSKTSQCGIYELPKRIIETETGYNRETVDKLLDRFVEYKKIKYCKETGEIFLINWLKHNRISSPKVRKCIYKDFEKEKKAIEQYLKLQMKNYEIAYVGDRKITWKKQERNSIDTTRLKKEHPEIVVGYMKTTTSRVLKI